MSTIKEFHLIVNPHSGSGKGGKIGKQVKQYLEQKNKVVYVHESQYAGHTTKIAADLAQKIAQHSIQDSLIIVIGGDGTIHESLNGLGERYASIPLGYIPSGSGNDFARGAGISHHPKKALEQILAASEPKELDVLSFLDAPTQHVGFSVNNIGLGLDASIIKEVNHSSSKTIFNKLKLQSLIYLSAVISHFIRQKPFPLMVDVDGEKVSFEKAFLVTTNNHPYFGSGIKISPKASVTDGKMDLIVVERISGVKFLKLFFILFTTGKHLEDKVVHYFKGEQIRLSVSSAIEGQTDGEELGYYPFDLTIQTTKRRFWFIIK
ncbi:diacylglycerol kinase family lipid kinase [Desemzia sp. RIT804]|uniref:diacylglycerol/lipid kinase family protein n=1 Tax=Desemzia sp. RIT 804 TaxID=2810209 RepID=UPI00194DCEA0|nr:diacylglycerol kinase family protein [Desemzia sp. RIT 804]MBM6613586.1 diacylglycerol kinase family lipid kinase [Desemzia sp. RIT 804]